jgi:glucose/arabinose dehydrogenase
MSTRRWVFATLVHAVRCCIAALAALAAADSAFAQSSLPLERIKLPPGFAIELVAQVPGAREMTWGARGTLFVGSRDGSVYALTFAAPDAQGTAKVTTIARGLRQPVGVAFRDGALYVSAVNRIVRFDDIERRLDAPPEPVVVTMVHTAGNSSPSGPTASSTFRSAHRATSASPIPIVTRTSRG